MKKILLVLLFIISCGAIENAVEELQPKVYNIVPGSPTGYLQENCNNCPAGAVLHAIYAVEIDATAWALGVDVAGGCAALSAGHIELYLRTPTGQGDYERYPDMWVISSTPSDCYQGIAIWRPLLYLCASKWCGHTDYWVEVYIEMPGDYYIQKFVKPTAEIPGMWQ